MLEYTAIAAMIVVPQFVLIHPYLHLLIIAPLLVWTGSKRALVQAQKQAAGEKVEVETVSKKDAMQFPLVGSCVLFGLYMVVKFVKKEYLDLLIAFYFSVIGAFALYGVACPPVTAALGGEGYKQHAFSIHWKLWKAKGSEGADPIEWTCSVFDCGLFAVCAATSGW